MTTCLLTIAKRRFFTAKGGCGLLVLAALLNACGGSSDSPTREAAAKTGSDSGGSSAGDGGTGDVNSGSNQAERCVLGDAQTTQTETRELTLGSMRDDAFVATGDNSQADLIFGPQGGYMLTPTLRVSSLAGDSPHPCFFVTLNNSTESQVEVVPELRTSVIFARRGEYLYSDEIYNLLTYDELALSGVKLTMRSTVKGLNFEATSQATVRVK